MRGCSFVAEHMNNWWRRKQVACHPAFLRVGLGFPCSLPCSRTHGLTFLSFHISISPKMRNEGCWGLWWFRKDKSWPSPLLYPLQPTHNDASSHVHSMSQPGAFRSGISFNLHTTLG